MNIGKGRRVARKLIPTCIRLMECKMSLLLCMLLYNLYNGKYN